MQENIKYAIKWPIVGSKPTAQMIWQWQYKLNNEKVLHVNAKTMLWKTADEMMPDILPFEILPIFPGGGVIQHDQICTERLWGPAGKSVSRACREMTSYSAGNH